MFEFTFASASLHLGSFLPATNSKPDSETHLKAADGSPVLLGENNVCFTSCNTVDTCLLLAVYFNYCIFFPGSVLFSFFCGLCAFATFQFAP